MRAHSKTTAPAVDLELERMLEIYAALQNDRRVHRGNALWLCRVLIEPWIAARTQPRRRSPKNASRDEGIGIDYALRKEARERHRLATVAKAWKVSTDTVKKIARKPVPPELVAAFSKPGMRNILNARIAMHHARNGEKQKVGSSPQ